MSTVDGAAAKSEKPGRKFRGLSPEERQRQRRDQLIEAGLETFGNQGFHSVGVREICAAAHLTERYFYESFDNREALFSAVYDRAVSRIRSAMEESLSAPHSDVSSVARGALAVMLRVLRGEPRLARILFIDVLTVGVDVGRQSILATQSFADMVLSAVSRIYPQLEERRVDPRLLANGLVGSTLYIVMQWALNGFQEPIDQVLDHSVLFYDAIAREALGQEPTREPQGSKPIKQTPSRGRRAAQHSRSRGAES